MLRGCCLQLRLQLVVAHGGGHFESLSLNSLNFILGIRFTIARYPYILVLYGLFFIGRTKLSLATSVGGKAYTRPLTS